jgi:hypothetical protein
LGATLNWRRDPGYEQRMSENQIAIERSKERTKQIESEILRVRNDSELIEKTNLAGEERQRANRERNRAAVDEVGRRPWQENAKEKALSASIKRLCFPPESSSIPQTSIEPDSKPSLPS